MQTRYKHIYFEGGVGMIEGFPVYQCCNNHTGEVLKSIEYYTPWGEYCAYDTYPTAFFSADCLRDIASFLDQLNEQEKGKEGK